MKTLKELMEARAAVKGKIDAALYDEKKELRSLNKEQRDAVVLLEAEYDELSEQIAIAERSEARNAAAAKLEATRQRRAKSTDHEGGLVKRASEKFSLLKAMESHMRGNTQDGIEKEVIELGRQEMRTSGAGFGEGVTIPSALIGRAGDAKRAAMTSGTAGDGAEWVATELGDMVPVLALNPVLDTLGVTRFDNLQGNLSLPRQTSAFVPTYLAETANGAESQPDTDDIDVTPKRAGGYVDASKLFLIQSTVAAEAWLRTEMAKGLSRLYDQWALYDGPNSNGNGALSLAGNTVALGANGAAPTWEALMQLTGSVDEDFALEGNLKFLTTAKMRSRMRVVKRDAGSGLFLWADDNTIGGFDAMVAQVLPKTLTKGANSDCHAILFGNFADLVFCTWGGVDILYDPFTQANGGKSRFVINAYADSNVKHANSFAKILDARDV